MSTLRLPLLLLGLTSLITSGRAQNDYDLDKVTPGTLGGPLRLAIAGAPAGALYFVMPSLSAGPTPVALVDPGDPRSVQVGLDLAANWFLGFTSAAGAAQVNLQLPLDASLQGVVLHWQTATVPGATTVVGQISNDVVTQVGMPGVGALAPSSLFAGRSFAAVIASPAANAGGGDVLVAGGGNGTLTAATGLSSTERWDFRRLMTQAGPGMNVARSVHLAVELLDGRTLLIGGADAAGAVLASCEIYDPATNSFAPTGSMASPRIMHAAARLADGRVLVAGGTNSLVDVTSTINGTLNSAEIYNPTTGTWSGAPALGGNRLAPALTTLPNGRVMCSGGVQVGFFFGLPVSAVSTTAVQFYNPATNSWSNGPPMPAGRAGHHFNQVTLADGRVLMSGGVLVPSLLGATAAASITAADLYDPVTNSWTAGSLGQSRSLHTATRLSDGRVIVCGGAQGTLTAPLSLSAVEAFDPATNSWSPLPALTGPRSGHAAALMPNGLLVLFGGQGAASTIASIETLHF